MHQDNNVGVMVANMHPCRERSTTQVLQSKVSSVRTEEDELDRLVQTKVIEPERYSDWATPIVPVLKT